MKAHRSFSVVPQLPKSLEHLRDLAWNLRFSWDPATVDLFRMMDADLWEAAGHNPVLFLGRMSQERLEACAADDAILANLERVWKDFDGYRRSDATWFNKEAGSSERPRIAYFSAEFGLSGCLPLYSGGLGILAGDHLKSASDLGLPLVGVGLCYQRGYFRQYLNSDGWQQERYPRNDLHNLPLRAARDADGNEVVVKLPLHGKTLHVKVWRCDVGRVPLILMDTNIEENDPDFRGITFDLYGGDSDMRLHQEYVLGVGGVRVLDQLGLTPDVCHMNEGHSGFLALERMRLFMEQGYSFPEARVAQAASTVFTTHTPVKAAVDLFTPAQMESIFKDWRRAFDMSLPEFMSLGREDATDEESPFNMAVFAFRMADIRNGVAKLHGHVSRGMWNHLWPGVPRDEVPVTSITNGVHSQTWISREMRGVFDRYLGPRWVRDPHDSGLWENVEKIPAEVLWRTHEAQKHRLVSYVRSHFREQLEHANATAVEIAGVSDLLDAQALTIGFARRFAPYKRATLMLRDPERLVSILTDSRRPVQILIAGKAHPRDEAGKKLIQDLVHFARRDDVKGHIVFVEDYDMDVASHLINGVDVWLNNPRRPLEASGTSGMKASLNGAINCSVPDGWWDEAAGSHLGWTIGNGESYDDEPTQDAIESGAFYDLLEHEIAPLFYDRGRDGLPRGWIRMMKEAIKGVAPVFNTHRMVTDYASRFYLPLAARSARLEAEDGRGVRDLAAWRLRVEKAWPGVQVVEVDSDNVSEVAVGQSIAVRARVGHGELSADDIQVQIFHGEVGPDGILQGADSVPMQRGEVRDDGTVWYVGQVPCERTGHRGFSVRVLPHHEDLVTPFLPGLIRWSSDPVEKGQAEPVPV